MRSSDGRDASSLEIHRLAGRLKTSCSAASSKVNKPSFDDEFWQTLASSSPTGDEVSADVVKSWFDSIWPVYCAYAEEAKDRSKTKRLNHKLRLSNWWRRVRREEIQAARERLALLTESRENEELEELARAINEEDRTSRASTPRLRVVKGRNA